MPLLKYIAKHPEGHELRETQLYPRGETPEAILKKHEPLLKTCTLLRVENIDPFTHSEHDWTRINRMGERIHYECGVCGCQAYNIFNNFRGEIRCFVREGKWANSKFEKCKDPLKAMPPSTKIF